METKKCTKCGEVKALTEFRRAKNRKAGFTSICKVCKKAQTKNYKAIYRDNQKKKRAKWYADNPEKVLVRKDKRIIEITDSLVASYLKVSVKECPPELLELKREQLKLHRLTKQLKKEIKNV